jgi:hypothetical protein
MSTWTSDELEKIAAVDELQIASVRNGGTLRKPVTIWVVRLGDDLYVRSVNGRDSAWFRRTEVRHEGHIDAGGVAKDVTFVDAVHGLDDQIDATYRQKYRRYAAGIVNSIMTPRARAATLKLVPRMSGERRPDGR